MSSQNLINSREDNLDINGKCVGNLFLNPNRRQKNVRDHKADIFFNKMAPRLFQSSCWIVCLSVCLSVPKVVIVKYHQTVRVLVFHHYIYQIWDKVKFLNLKGHQNCTIGSKFTAILMTKSGVLQTIFF